MMKKSKYILGLIMAICLILGAAACSNGASSSENDSVQAESETNVSADDNENTDTFEPDGNESGVVVAYFSATGNTKAVAEKIAEITGGELYEITPADPYTDEDLDYGNSESRTSLEMDDLSARPEISGAELSLDGCTTLYLGYPIWHGQAPRIMDTFVESYDFDGITVIPFCTSGSSGIGASAERLAELAQSGNWLAGERFSSGVSDSELQSWIDDLQ